MSAPSTSRPGAVRALRPLAVVLAVLLAAGAGLGGCALPHSGPVEQGLDIGSPLLPPVRFQFEAPPRGAEPEQIVRGFLAASWSSDDDFRAARAYLTAPAAKAWNPRGSVTVYPNPASLQIKVSSGRAHLSTAQDASLDASGRYRSMPLGAERRATLGLARVSGEWRISSVPADFGLWMSRFYFERAFRPFTVAYADERMHTIVGDRRWFAVGGGLATSLARAQVEQPPPYLAGAVRSGFPRGTRLAVDSVPVVGGQARIDLSSGVLEVNADERRAAWAQALTTMRQVPDVDSVALQVAGSTLDVLTKSPGSVPTSLHDLGFATSVAPPDQVLWRSGSQLFVVSVEDLGRRQENIEKGTRASLPTLPQDAAQVAVSTDLNDVSAIVADGSTLVRWRDGHERRFADLGARLTAPAYDWLGWLWIGAGQDAGAGRVWVVDTSAGIDARPRSVGVPWLSGQQILVARPAPDGQRLLVLARGSAGVRLGVSGIVRDPRGQPTALTSPWWIGGDVQDAISASWVTNTTVGVLGTRHRGADPVPLLVSVGGQTTVLAPVAGALRLVAAVGERGVIVVSGDGHAFGRVGAGWQQIATIDDLIVPGF